MAFKLTELMQNLFCLGWIPKSGVLTELCGKMFAEILTSCKSLNQNISKLLILNIPPTQVTGIVNLQRK